MNILRRMAARLPHNDSVALIVPLQNRTRTDAKPLTYFGRYRDLTLCGELRMSDRHARYITTVMNWDQRRGPRAVYRARTRLSSRMLCVQMNSALPKNFV